ncbi:hypothetical protein CROQUDRAFT_724992 [Cronartium quercuum f. sp. fusiforme G11]|uniref:Uncharacterized protein n=1 Tax=Cronartium quercuum f. sp. fusiforme G11 TaxID=708437 RepID=A0A9P6NBR7_9BASI|nr:hypothetical protein CROQUDRAFT_724992 [Cronartium quercuum f. sp. fusiforme G11]
MVGQNSITEGTHTLLRPPSDTLSPAGFRTLSGHRVTVSGHEYLLTTRQESGRRKRYLVSPLSLMSLVVWTFTFRLIMSYIGTFLGRIGRFFQRPLPRAWTLVW